MKKYILYLAVATLILNSCNFKGGESERLKAQNDSLMQSKAKLESEVNEYFSAMNEIQENIDKIKETQNTISVQPLSENTPTDVREKVTEDMAYLNDMIKTNREELNNLKSKLKRSSFKLSDVEKTLAQLTKSLEEESAKVATLQAQISQKDSVITTLNTKVGSLNTRVSTLGKDVDDLSSKNTEQESKINKQDEALNTAWYAIGSKKELKDNKIITSSGMFSASKVLQSDFNKNYFVKIDARNTKQIPLYSTSKAKILTSHPKSSYMLENENENYVIYILDPALFWSVSKYLVVEVD
jgi:DNA repair exonuclease SbcCD ATPase subunit